MFERLYVVWHKDDQGRWRRTEAMDRDKAFTMAEEVLANHGEFLVVPDHWDTSECEP